MIKLGRNDLCHCGSGKKYKKCHLDADQGERPALAKAPVEPAPPVRSWPLKGITKLVDEISQNGSAREREMLLELEATSGPILKFMSRQKEICAALEILNSHVSRFAEVVADAKRFEQLARRLFTEECFVPLRFTADDVQRAFEHVGYPASMAMNDRAVAIFRAAILYLADKNRRSNLSMNLLLLLPDYVSTKRYFEGLLLQSAAEQTAEESDEPNFFLFRMFSYGFEAWTARNQKKSESLFDVIGLAPETVKDLPMQDVLELVEAKSSDPEFAARFEAVLQENPQFRGTTMADIEVLERNSTQILDHPAARSLFLPLAELEPWLLELQERLAGFGDFAEKYPEEKREEFGREVVVPVFREITNSIFTAERMQQLVADLKLFRAERFAAGDTETARYAHGAITYVSREDSPGKNAFLVNLCWRSVSEAFQVYEAGNGLKESI